MILGILSALIAPIVGVVAPIIEAAKPDPDVQKARIALKLERLRLAHELELAKLAARK